MIKSRLKICRKYIIALAVLGSSCWLMAGISYGEPMASSELINNAKQYDGKTIQYKGEVIGDIMKRGEHAWINISDGQNAIGVWVDNSLTKDITYTGGYKTRGDNVEFVGIFHRACIEHGGDLDIHCQSLIKITSGIQIYEALDFNKIKVAFILSGVLLVLLLCSLLIRKK